MNSQYMMDGMCRETFHKIDHESMHAGRGSCALPLSKSVLGAASGTYLLLLHFGEYFIHVVRVKRLATSPSLCRSPAAQPPQPRRLCH